MHSDDMLREGARPEVVRDNMGHANIGVTQNVYGKSWWPGLWHVRTAPRAWIWIAESCRTGGHKS
jgi:hypothetical protein